MRRLGSKSCSWHTDTVEQFTFHWIEHMYRQTFPSNSPYYLHAQCGGPCGLLFFHGREKLPTGVAPAAPLVLESACCCLDPYHAGRRNFKACLPHVKFAELCLLTPRRRIACSILYQMKISSMIAACFNLLERPCVISCTKLAVFPELKQYAKKPSVDPKSGRPSSCSSSDFSC